MKNDVLGDVFEEIPDRSKGEQSGIQSIETGMKLFMALASLSSQGPAPQLKTLAAQADMAPAKAHRYLVSFIRTGLVERELQSNRYVLGPTARRIGLAALRTHSPISVAMGHLPAICEELDNTVAVAVWGDMGPVVVGIEEAPKPVLVSTRIGQVLPLLSSATGRVYAAWLPGYVTKNMILKEIRNNRKLGAVDSLSDMKSVQEMLEQTRAAGIGLAAGSLNASINAMSAPIFDYRGSLVAAISVLGPIESVDIDPEGQTANALRRVALEISNDLGYDQAAE